MKKSWAIYSSLIQPDAPARARHRGAPASPSVVRRSRPARSRRCRGRGRRTRWDGRDQEGIAMATRVAINGFGRVGRCAFRSAIERGADVEGAALNDGVDADMLDRLLRHDSVYGPFPGMVEVEGNALVVDGRVVPVLGEKQPERLPWSELGVDVVLECTGRFRARADAAAHLAAGARKVIVSAPGRDVDATLVLGVNFETYDPEGHAVISNASC